MQNHDRKKYNILTFLITLKRDVKSKIIPYDMSGIMIRLKLMVGNGDKF